MDYRPQCLGTHWNCNPEPYGDNGIESGGECRECNLGVPMATCVNPSGAL